MGRVGGVSGQYPGSFREEINPAMTGKIPQRALVKGVKRHDPLKKRDRHIRGDRVNIVSFYRHFFIPPETKP
jgi:hypothetical protein